MPAYVPLSVQQKLAAEQLADTEIYLITITDPSTGFVARLSSHPTERLSTDPLQYGTNSGGNQYLYEAMGTTLPGDKEGAPLTVSLSLENVDRDRAADIRALTSLARVSLAMALASDPETTFRPITSMKIVGRKIDAQAVTLELTRQAAEPGNTDLTEPWPVHRMSKIETPGLHR